jgi:excisionase family DNA binding protein
MINKQAISDDGIYSPVFQHENDITDLTDPLWTVDDMAGYLQLQPETIRSMARRGELPAIKLGKVWRFRKSAIQEMLVERVHETLPDMLIPSPVTVIPGEDV